MSTSTLYPVRLPTYFSIKILDEWDPIDSIIIHIIHNPPGRGLNDVRKHKKKQQKILSRNYDCPYYRVFIMSAYLLIHVTMRIKRFTKVGKQFVSAALCASTI